MTIDPVSLGITLALTAASMAMTASQKIEGPRLDSTKFTGGDYGAALHLTWGKRRLEVPIFFAEDLKEVRRRRKTKGGKFNEYTYFGTWACAIAGHEIGAVRRIWFDTHLVYDLSGAGPVTPFDFGGAGVISDFITIYTGTETQEPDPRMQATIEALHGEGSCPAYRGTAYVIFKDVPLEKLGNRIPQVSVEVASGETFPYETVEFDQPAARLTFATDYSTAAVVTTDDYTIFDVASKTVIASGALPDTGLTDFNHGIGFNSSGHIVYGRTDNVVFVDVDGSVVTSVAATGMSGDGTAQTLMRSDGEEVWWAEADSGDYDFLYNGVEHIGEDVFGAKFWSTSILLDMDDKVWAVGTLTQSATTEVYFWGLDPDMVNIQITGLDNGDPAFDVDARPLAFHYQDADHDHFVLAWGPKLYLINRADGAILGSYTPDEDNAILTGFKAIRPGSATFWIGFEEISSKDLTQVRLLDRADWDGSPSSNSPAVYDPINHALIVRSGDTLTWFYLDRVGSDGVPLSEICDDVAEWCGVVDADFTALDQVVQGWSATQGQASNMLEPLLDAFDSDIRPHDFTLQGIKRSGVSTGTILTERFAAGDPRYSIKIRQAAELPLQISVSFADVDAEQQPNAALSPRSREATAAKGAQTIDMSTWATDATEAKQLTDRYFRRIWNQRREVSNSLTAQMLALEPGDCKTLDLDGETDTYRLVSLVVKANDVLATEWKYDHPSLAVLNGATGAGFDGRNEAIISIAVLSKGFVLDVPYLTDADDQSAPVVYPLAAPYAPGSWPGATIYQAVDGEYSEELAAVASSDAATWGYVAEELPYANPNLWDRGNEITVTLKNGTLAGCTEAAIDANPRLNLVAIGMNGRWELVNFTVAALTAPNTYTVSGFKRGRRGTEWAAEIHVANDQFVLVEAAEEVALGLSEVGTDVSFKAITATRSTGFPFGYMFTGASLKPYAPCHLEAVKESNGDWTLTWVRRTRVGGAWTSGTPIPLSEATEEYDVVLSDGVDDVTKTVTSPTYTWTQVDQITDVGAEVMEGDLEWTVYQISDAVDRGFAAEATA